MSDSTCSAISLALEEPMAGTGPRDGAVYVLIAWDGEWPRDGVPASALPEAVRHAAALWVKVVPRLRVLLSRHGLERKTAPAVHIFRTTPGSRLSLRFDLARIEDAASLDVPGILERGQDERATVLTEPHYFVCVHGKRDACCALLGGRVASALYAHASERVHRVSHLGGHRFAAVVVSLPDGMCYGRVAPEHAETLVREHTAGRLYDLAYLRGRSGFDEPSQAAEIAHRRATGIREIDDVLPVTIEKVETGARVVLDVRGEGVTLDVSKETLSIERPASCGEPNTRAITLRALRV